MKEVTLILEHGPIFNFYPVSKLNLPSPHLRKITISSKYFLCFHISAASKKLRHIELRSLTLVKLEIDLSHLDFLTINSVNFKFDFLSQLMTAEKLKYLNFSSSYFANYSNCIETIENIIKLKNLGKIDLRSRHSDYGPSPDHLVYFGTVHSSHKISPMVFAEFENQFKNVGINLNYKDERPFKRFEDLNAYEVKLDINRLDDRLVSFFTQNYPYVSEAVFYNSDKNDGLSIGKSNTNANHRSVSCYDHSFVKLMKLLESWKSLIYLRGPFNQEQVYQILTNFPIKQLEIRSKYDRGTSVPLTEDLHDIMVKLVESKSLKVFFGSSKELPWSCTKCNDHPCPFFKIHK